MSGWLSIKFDNKCIFPDPGPPIINILYVWSGIYYYKRLLWVVMRFHQIFPNYPYFHKDKHLFAITKQIYKDYHYKIGKYLEIFHLIHLLIFSILFCIPCVCKLIYYFFTSTKQHSELILIFSMHDLHSILLKVPDMLSTSSDNEVDINLKLSINFSKLQ